MIAIDLGSNTIRGIKMNCQKNSFEESFERMVKTADGLSTTGEIAQATVERIVDALDAMKKEIDFHGESIVAKTTAALRMASNSEEVIKLIYQRTGVLFEVIDAKQEAFYTQLAVKSRLELLNAGNECLLLDVGGGSTEVIVCSDEGVESMSVDVGIVTMSQSYKDKESLVKSLYSSLEPVKHFMQSIENKPKMLVSTAGTPTTMASMKQGLTVKSYDPTIVNGTILNDDDLERQLQRLLDMDEEQRALHVGVGRDSLIVTGVEILRVLMDLLEYDEMIVIDDGLREGLAIDECRKSLKI